MKQSNRLHRFQTDMEKWFRSIALIRRSEEGKNFWLARPSIDRKGTLDFVSAPRLQRESFRETIRREVSWSLDVDPRKDLLISNMSQLNLEFVACLPQDFTESHIAVSFFLVELYGKQVKEQVFGDSNNRWLSSAEVCAGQSRDGEPLDPRLIFLLDRARVINAWD